jgi:hypothetical protein
MLYAVICYNSEAVVGAWSKEKDDMVMQHHQGVLAKMAAKGQVGPVARLMPTTTAITVRTGREMMVLDGPFAETKEQMLGFYLFDCETLEEVIAAARELVSEPGAMEIRPVKYFNAGLPDFTAAK